MWDKEYSHKEVYNLLSLALFLLKYSGKSVPPPKKLTLKGVLETIIFYNLKDLINEIRKINKHKIIDVQYNR
jgi:hypothetical protein